MSRATALAARFNARRQITDDYLEAARRSAELSYRSELCSFREHKLCDGKVYPDVQAERECLCTCHDPESTYWVEWSNVGGVLQAGSMVSGPYDTADEAIDHGFAAKLAEAEWIREQVRSGRYTIEQVTEERWDALMGWDEKTEAERAELRPGSETA